MSQNANFLRNSHVFNKQITLNKLRYNSVACMW